MSFGSSIIAKLGLDSGGFKRGLNESQADISRFKSTMSGVLGAVSFASVLGGLRNFSTYCSDAVDKSLRFGETVETIQRVDAVAKKASSSVEQVAAVVSGLAVKAKGAAEGSEEMEKGFKAVGINAKEFLKMDMEGRLVELARAYDNCNGDQDKMASLLDLVGGKGSKIFPMLAGGAESFKAALESVKVVTNEVAQQMDELGDKMDDMKQTLMSWTGASVGFVADLATSWGEIFGGKSDPSLLPKNRKPKPKPNLAEFGDDEGAGKPAAPSAPASTGSGGTTPDPQAEYQKQLEEYQRQKDEYANEWLANNDAVGEGMKEAASSLADFLAGSSQERGNTARARREADRRLKRTNRTYGINKGGLPENQKGAQRILRDQKRGKIGMLDPERQSLVEKIANGESLSPANIPQEPTAPAANAPGTLEPKVPQGDPTSPGKPGAAGYWR